MMNYKNILAVAILLAVVGVLSVWRYPSLVTGSVNVGNEYVATTTSHMTNVHNQITTDKVTTLGSIVIASSSPTTFTIWNATSTTDTASTSIATFSAEVAPGTYTIDAYLDRGLTVETPTGFDGDYVITFRPQ